MRCVSKKKKRKRKKKVKINPPIYFAELQCNEALRFPLIPLRHSPGLAAAFYCPLPMPECYRGSRQTDNGVVQRASATLFRKRMLISHKMDVLPAVASLPDLQSNNSRTNDAYVFSGSATNGFENIY